MNINIVRTSAEYFINSCVEMYMTTSTLLLIKVDLLKKLRTQSCMARSLHALPNGGRKREPVLVEKPNMVPSHGAFQVAPEHPRLLHLPAVVQQVLVHVDAARLTAPQVLQELGSCPRLEPKRMRTRSSAPSSFHLPLQNPATLTRRPADAQIHEPVSIRNPQPLGNQHLGMLVGDVRVQGHVIFQKETPSLGPRFLHRELLQGALKCHLIRPRLQTGGTVLVSGPDEGLQAPVHLHGLERRWLSLHDAEAQLGQDVLRVVEPVRSHAQHHSVNPSRISLS
jgi:hypothetical protein